MTISIFLTMLLACSSLTSLTVEGIKKLTEGMQVKYSSNVVAATVAIVLAVAIACGYTAYMGLTFSVRFVICLIALGFLSWLCAMVGYDKVIQALSQLDKQA